MSVLIIKGDTVILRRGKEKGKRGVVKAVVPKKGIAFVEGINVVKRHTKQGAAGAKTAGIYEKEARIPISALTVVDPKTGLPTRVRRGTTPDGRGRLAVRSGEALPASAKGR
ncbi:MAG: 50S ribosomal protein L24 [Candidatus Eremiobacteraeota bacterium]|nr:50S ribosomal protein L24 [Candidatus Eremiobacteraeota bacterium]MBV9647497.1 50S ribosomal protein L24 [Candidatus Eremiobacteraeota bacterium]